MKAKKIIPRNSSEFKVGDRAICKGQRDSGGILFGETPLRITKMEAGKLQFSDCNGGCWHPAKDFKKI